MLLGFVSSYFCMESKLISDLEYLDFQIKMVIASF